jgi:hypothetical protein
MELVNRTNLIIGAVVGLIVGLILGIVLCYWGPLKIEYVDAHSYNLSPAAKAEYVGLVADSFRVDQDPVRVAAYFDQWWAEEKSQAFADAITLYEAEGRPEKVQAIQDLAIVLDVTPAAEGEGEEQPPAEAPAEDGGLWDRIRVPCLVFFVILLVLVLGWIGLRVALRQRAEREGLPGAGQPTTVMPAADVWEGTGQPPLGHFFTTYELGEDTYDESFSIETPMGEFMGECGVGISETIGSGVPDKVTAFEVWLFDKSDIRTVTKVLMSQHAYEDNALRAKLASKGEAILAQPGASFVLETSSLRVDVEVSELVYGEGELPARSFFSKLMVQLVANAKPAESTL